MNKIESNKTKQINDILSVVKLSSLLFSGMGFFEYFVTTKKDMFQPSNTFYIGIAISGILILTLIYCTWAFSAVNKINNISIHHVQKAENLIIVLIFF
ncbi:MAG: diguanylate cyclase, partial [Bacillota bacterium]|nr:diguanylate cyclase [Bacillota bacterium]